MSDTPEEIQVDKKVFAGQHRIDLEIGARVEILMEQVAKLLCPKDATPEKVKAVQAEMEAEARRRVAKHMINLDRVNPELSALLDDLPLEKPPDKSPPTSPTTT